MKEERFSVQGMHCASCAFIIRDSLKKTPGVAKVEVNYASETANVSYEEDKVDIAKMNATIGAFGYTLMQKTPNDTEVKMAVPSLPQSDPKTKETERMRNSVRIIFPISLIVFGIMIWNSLSEIFVTIPHFPISMMVLDKIYMLVAFVLFATVGKKYLVALLRFTKHRVANMDTLVGLGTFTAFVYSTILALFPAVQELIHAPEKLYFDTTIIVIGFILLGDYLVVRSRLKTGEALQKLIGLQAKSATVVRDGKEVEVGIDQLVQGDIFIVKPGQKVAIDGIIVEGSTSIDESVITGESMPVDKTVGEVVVGATINKQGFLKVRVSKVGGETMLAQIIQMVEKAQDSRAPIQDLVDTITAVFVPAVLAIALVTLVIWSVAGRSDIGLTSFIAILVVACPCAMGLATPIAIIVGVGKAAQMGILIKDAESLQRLSTVDYVVFDKTGTITKGQPEVIDVIPKQPNAFQILASLESKSEHPIAQAVVKKAKIDNIELLPVINFSVIAGKGLVGEIDGVTYYAGNQRLMSDKNVEMDEVALDGFTTEGKTPIILTTAEKVVGYVAVADTIRAESPDVVQKLHELGIKVAMISGDHVSVANNIAKLVGIDTVIAEVLPQDKAYKVTELQKSGHRVAMVGDGINDAPALASADVGIAMGTGTDIAIESAGITLLGGSIGKVYESILLAKATMRTIRQNLFWAFFYNIVGIPIAAGILYPMFRILLTPAIEGAAMAFSSLSVVGNSLRLKYVKLA